MTTCRLNTRTCYSRTAIGLSRRIQTRRARRFLDQRLNLHRRPAPTSRRHSANNWWSATTGYAAFSSSSKERIEVRSTASGQTSRSEEHTSELQSQSNLVCRLLLEK